MKGCRLLQDRPARIEVATTDGDESFYFEFTQYFLFFCEEIVVIPVLKILEGDSFFRPGKNLGLGLQHCDS